MLPDPETTPRYVIVGTPGRAPRKIAELLADGRTYVYLTRWQWRLRIPNWVFAIVIIALRQNHDAF